MSAFRKLTVYDTPALIRHWCSLDASERNDRFHGTVSDDVITALAEKIDWTRTTLIGFFDAGVLRGVAMVAFDATKSPFTPPTCGELALDIQSGWQGRGVGTRLADRALNVAQNKGCRKLLILTTPQNRRMRQIGARMGGSAALEDGLVVITLDLTAATPFSHWLEAAQQTSGAIFDLSDRITGRLWSENTRSAGGWRAA